MTPTSSPSGSSSDTSSTGGALGMSVSAVETAAWPRNGWIGLRQFSRNQVSGRWYSFHPCVTFFENVCLRERFKGPGYNNSKHNNNFDPMRYRRFQIHVCMHQTLKPMYTHTYTQNYVYTHTLKTMCTHIHSKLCVHTCTLKTMCMHT